MSKHICILTVHTHCAYLHTHSASLYDTQGFHFVGYSWCRTLKWGHARHTHHHTHTQWHTPLSPTVSVQDIKIWRSQIRESVRIFCFWIKKLLLLFIVEIHKISKFGIRPTPNLWDLLNRLMTSDLIPRHFLSANRKRARQSNYVACSLWGSSLSSV